MGLAKDLACVYFTPLPYILHEQIIRCENVAYAGVGIGLIQSQQMFWVSNAIMTAVIYNRNNLDFLFLNIFLFHFSIGLYILSFVKSTNLIRYMITQL